MKPKKAFCDCCMDDVNFEIKQQTKTGKIKEKTYSYSAKVPFCKKCGNKLYVPSLHDANLEALYDKYRKENYIVSLKTIKELPEKYSIGKRPLSNLLGWGELTYTRYVDGDVPSLQYSKIISKMYNDPGYFLNILESNKNNISNSAYNKSMNACKKLLKEAISQDKKINQVALCIIYWYKEVSKTALQKNLYYIQGFSKAFTNKFMFSENCQAWIHGPVFREVYDKFESLKLHELHNEPLFDVNIFTDEEFNVISGVLNSLGKYNGDVLEKITHKEKPWLNARKGLKKDERAKNIINKNDIASYFTSVKEKYNMLSPDDIKDYSEAMVQTI